MRASRELKVFLIAGGIIGLLGVAAFGIVHAVIIFPIWRRLLAGVPFGVGGGLIMGWALYELRAAGRWAATAWNGLAFGLLLWLTLFPMTAFGAGALAGWLSGRRTRLGRYRARSSYG